ncbi:MAG TPA: PhoU domain-containing protein [Candidatus Krumholzibacteria bacterium]|nr:PhoU domain-containing protein [Candidatus Krumholzibacteria bacterium]
MKFGSILDLFRADNWSNELVEKISEMLDISGKMFAYATSVVIEGAPDEDVQDRIYERDKRINKLERKIRRRVVSRLAAASGTADVPSALIFMNVVKDAERLGDYAKNLHEIRAMMPAQPDLELYRKHLAAPAAALKEIHAKTRKAFAESNGEVAGEVIQTARAQGRAYEAAIRAITTSDMRTQDAVCIVLTLRFFKRIAAHMSNIATTVVMPIDLIDFYDEPEKQS